MTTSAPTSTSTSTLISTVPELREFLSSIHTSSTLYLDLEGNNLCRHGTLTLLTVLVHPQNTVGLIDVAVLEQEAFTTASSNGSTLKSILEDAQIPKCLWDVRNDADALYAHFQVGLAGVIDIQLLENASRPSSKRYLNGLERCIRDHVVLKFEERQRWSETKQGVRRLMDTDIFTVRPLNEKTIAYCINDVLHLPALHTFYLGRIEDEWKVKAMEESTRRVEEAHSSEYEPQSSSKKFGPWGSCCDDWDSDYY